MNMTIDRAGFTLVSEETRGQAIERRFEAIGIYSAREMERASERVGRRVPRGSIGKALADTASAAIYQRVEAVLAALEDEIDSDAPAPVIRFVLHNVYGVGEVVAEGPVENREEVADALAKLIRDMRRESDE